MTTNATCTGRIVVVIAVISVILLHQAPQAMAWTLEGDVTDSHGQAISRSWLDPLVTVDKVGYGVGLSGASRGKSHYVRNGIRDSDHGCTVQMAVIESCFRGGIMKLDRCGGTDREHLTMNWTVYADRAPTVTIILDNGKRTTLTAKEIPIHPILFTGSFSCRIRGSHYRFRPVAGILVKILDGHNGWRVLKEATSDREGRYAMLLTPKCPTNPQLRIVIDPQKTGYRGSRSLAWNGAHWALYTLYPPVASVHAGGPGGADFIETAEPLEPGGATFPGGLSCEEPPPEGAKGLPLCSDGCVEHERRAPGRHANRKR